MVCGLLGRRQTLKVEQDVRLVVFEHLSDELNVHVLDVDLLHVMCQRKYLAKNACIFYYLQ